MPELPEVETVCRSLRHFVIDQTITGLQILHKKSFICDSKFTVINKTIKGIQRRGKFIILVLDDGNFVVTHLKMTGQLLYKGSSSTNDLAGGGHPASDTLEQLPGKHTRIIYDLRGRSGECSQLFFNDMRIFGWMKVVDKFGLAEMFAALGPDANDPTVDAEALYARLQRKRLPIKQTIMDNKLWTGVGNIYASEILFEVGVDPRTPSNKISLATWKKIIFVTRKILDAAVAAGGTTFDGRYVDALGRAGDFERALQVYGRAGENCRCCGTILENVKLGGRSSIYCPRCQK